MSRLGRGWAASTVVGLVGVLVLAWGAVPTSAASSAPGITPHGILVGMITSATGPAAPEYINYQNGAQARFDAQNAAGGVFGRKITMIAEEDAGNPTADGTLAQSLISKGVFGLIIATPFFYDTGYKYPQQQGVPVVGGGYDGAEWGLKQDTNMFSTTGDTGPNFLQNSLNTGEVNFMKSLGAHNVAALGYSISPSSAASAEGVEKAATHVGLKAAYLNTSIPFGGSNVEPDVLQMKAAGVDAMALQMDNNTNFAILTAADQSGMKLKAAISATGYGSSLLSDASAVQAAQGAYFISEGPPLNSSAEKAFRANLKKYFGFSGVPGFDWYEGYTQADLFIKGMQVAGKNPTRQAFISNLRKVTNYTANGLFSTPVDFSLKDFGKPPNRTCTWYAQLKGNTFVPVPASGKPTCGTRFSG